jgi:hypothetical protein
MHFIFNLGYLFSLVKRAIFKNFQQVILICVIFHLIHLFKKISP